jgi:hypothetical protein
LLQALEELPGPVFTPGDLVTPLQESEAWSLSFAKAKGSDEKARHKVMAAKVGYALRSFRLQRLRHGASGYEYDLGTAVNTLRAHVPGNHANSANHAEADHLPSQPDVIQGSDTPQIVHGSDGTDPAEEDNHAIPQPDAMQGGFNGLQGLHGLEGSQENTEPNRKDEDDDDRFTGVIE